LRNAQNANNAAPESTPKIDRESGHPSRKIISTVRHKRNPLSTMQIILIRVSGHENLCDFIAGLRYSVEALLMAGARFMDPVSCTVRWTTSSE
jgi:hypothetical protein